MKIRITGCKDPQLWYNDQIGNTFDFRNIERFRLKDSWLSIIMVRDKEGFTNAVKKEDCRIILEHASHS